MSLTNSLINKAMKKGIIAITDDGNEPYMYQARLTSHASGETFIGIGPTIEEAIKDAIEELSNQEK